MNTGKLKQDRTKIARAILTGEAATPLQMDVIRLYDAGLNVFPLPFGSKSPVLPHPTKPNRHVNIRWKQWGLTHYRVLRDDLMELFSGQANVAVVVGKSSNNLFVIDCEDRQLLKWNIEQCDIRGIPVWATYTGRGGHLWFFSAEGEVRNISAYDPTKRVRSGHMQEVEIKGHDGYVVAPPSRHPNGNYYQWYRQDTPAPPTVSLKQIDWLTDVDDQPIQLKPTKKKRRKLHPETLDYLVNGAKEGSRNNRLFKAAVDVHNNGGGIDELWAIAQKTGLSNAEIETTLKSAQKPQYSAPKGRRKSKKRGVAIWQIAAAFLSVYDGFQGKSGVSDRIVFHALTRRAQLDSLGTGIFRATVRDIKELAHLSSTKTVVRALYRLQGMDQTPGTKKHAPRAVRNRHAIPLIEFVSRNELGASEYRFSGHVVSEGRKVLENVEKQDANAPAFGASGVAAAPFALFSAVSGVLGESEDSARGTIRGYPPICDDIVPLLRSPQVADIYERQAFGWDGMTIYHAILGQGRIRTLEEIAQQTNISVHIVKRALATDAPLRLFGVVQYLNKHWIAYPVTSEKLAEIAVKCGVGGATEKRKERGQEERSRYIGKRLIDWRRRHDEYYPRYRPYAPAKQQPAQSNVLDIAPLVDMLPTPAHPHPVVDPVIAEGVALGGEISIVNRKKSVNKRGETVQESVMILEKTA